MNLSRVFRIFGIMLIAGQAFLTWTAARAEEMTCPVHTPVSIDIKPGSYPNSINLSSQGRIAVAVLSTQDFDANLFTPEMAHLFDASAGMDEGCESKALVRWAREDINGDKQLDLVFFFDVQSLKFSSSTTIATLMSHGSYDSSTLHIMGTDTVKIKE